MHTTLVNTRLLEISALLGSVFPLVAAFFKQSGFSRRFNTIICVVLAAIAGVVTVAARGELDFHNWVGSFFAIYAAAQVAYSGLWKNVGEPTLVHKTSVVKDGANVVVDPAKAVSPASDRL